MCVALIFSGRQRILLRSLDHINFYQKRFCGKLAYYISKGANRDARYWKKICP